MIRQPPEGRKFPQESAGNQDSERCTSFDKYPRRAATHSSKLETSPRPAQSPYSAGLCGRGDWRPAEPGLLRRFYAPGLQCANELACEKLRPQVLDLMESLDGAVRQPAAAEVSNGASPDAKAVREASRPAPPLGRTEVAAVTSDEFCKRDGERLARLRGSPSGEEAERFANELDCERLRPQLLRLMESLGVTPPPPPNGADPGACRRETAELNRIRAAPATPNGSASVVTCDALKPQAACPSSRSRATEALNEL
jgi:hypothetical protein